MKKWIAVLIAWTMICPGASAISAEELTSGEELSSCEDLPNTEYDAGEFFYPEEDEAEIVWDGTEENEAEDIEDAFSGDEEDIPQAGTASGSFGSNLKWTLTDGVLTISGSGNMPDWETGYSAPWSDNWDEIKKVVVAEGVTSIGRYAFQFCKEMETVSIPKSVSVIGNYAFHYCSGLQSIRIPDGVKSVGVCVFQGCENLKTVTLPESVTVIKQFTFADCTGLTSIVFPDTLTDIEQYAFWGCKSLVQVVMPRNLKSIANSVFRDCSGLKEIYFSGNAPHFDGYIFTSDVTARVYYPVTSTWTVSVRQHYGGHLTWIPMARAAITGFYNSTKGGDIRWEKLNGAAGYILYRKRSADGLKKVATINNPDTMQYIDGGIKDNCWGRVYVYYVVPFYGAKKVNGPKSSEVTLQRIAPMKFTKAVSLSGRKMNLAWACTTNSNKANGYEIQYAASKEELFAGKGKKVTFNSRNKLSTTATAPKAGQTYYFRIRAYVLYTHSVTGQQTRTWSQYSNVVSIKVSKGS